MLSEMEIARFKDRIDDVLSNRPLTDWQRRFLSDIRGKIDRYGVKTRLSEKQLSMLTRLTQGARELNAGIVADRPRPDPFEAPQRLLARPRPKRPFDRNPLGRHPLRVRNPFRPRFLFRLPHAFHLLTVSGGRFALAILAILMVVGLAGSLFNHDVPVDNDIRTTSSGMSPPAPAVSGTAGFSVTDGDTIRLRDGTPVRLVGFNTPEKFEPQCSREEALGNRASARLKELVATATSTKVTLVACSCKPGTEGTKKCNYGRRCGTLTVDGRDVGQTMIAEDLAVPFICGVSGCPPTPRPWCG
jgi:endonuclease YncB( thermonuclease family)